MVVSPHSTAPLSDTYLLARGIVALLAASAVALLAGECKASSLRGGDVILIAKKDCPCNADRFGGFSQSAAAPGHWSPDGHSQGVWDQGALGQGTWHQAPMPVSPLPSQEHWSPPPQFPAAVLPSPPPLPRSFAGDGPPPGTLGRTYRVPTALVPLEKHPRVGMLDVYLPRDLLAREGFDDRHYIKATIEGIEGFIGDDGNWHFESDPLPPGVSHVYEVNFDVVRVHKLTEIQYGRTFEKEVEVTVKHLGFRTVRLIPGRIVELRY